MLSWHKSLAVSQGILEGANPVHKFIPYIIVGMYLSSFNALLQKVHNILLGWVHLNVIINLPV